MCILGSPRPFPGAGRPRRVRSIKEFPTPKEIQDVSSQPAAASCLVLALLPSLLGFHAVRFAGNGPVSEKKTVHRTRFPVWQCLRAEQRSDLGICQLFKFCVCVQHLLNDINCQEPESSCRDGELPRSAQGPVVT